MKMSNILLLLAIAQEVSGGIQNSPYCIPQNTTCWPAVNEWNQLSNQLTGSLKSLRDSSYGQCEAQGDDATKISSTGNGICMQYHDCSKQFCNKDAKWNIPAYSVEARNVADIQAALAFARKHNIAVTIKTSGHSYSGSSTGDGTLLIWMHKFQKYGNIKKVFTNCNKIHSNVLHLGGGQTWAEAYAAAGNDYYIVGGGGLTVSTSGGWLMGGGLSAISRNFGMGIDNVIQFEVVLADGRHVTADACTNQDLFWALRGGGGGTFGVVTSVHFQMHPSTTFVSVDISIKDVETFPHPTEKLYSFFDFWVKKSPHLDRRWGGYWTLNSLHLYFQGSKEEAGTTFLDDLIEWRNGLRLNGLEQIFVVPLTIKEWEDFYDWRKGIPTDKTGSKEFNIANRLIPRDRVISDPEGVKDLLKHLVHNGWYTFNYFLGGAMTDVDVDATSVQPAYRKALWQIETFDDKMIKKLREFVTKDSGSGLNHASKKEPNWETAFWGKHLPRLKQLKKTYDPDNRFNCWHCIGYQGDLPSNGSILHKISQVVLLLSLIIFVMV